MMGKKDKSGKTKLPTEGLVRRGDNRKLRLPRLISSADITTTDLRLSDLIPAKFHGQAEEHEMPRPEPALKTAAITGLLARCRDFLPKREVHIFHPNVMPRPEIHNPLTSCLQNPSSAIVVNLNEFPQSGTISQNADSARTTDSTAGGPPVFIGGPTASSPFKVKKQSFRAVQNMDSPAKANNNPPRKIFHHYRSGSPASGIPHRNEARFV
ncbi:MAG TPA: hypothetical protein VMD74_03455, partial [Candidatus Methylomirabilis sp.]|nr:hypothetical protein [Candidatus Methylomirabilis sp.]